MNTFFFKGADLEQKDEKSKTDDKKTTKPLQRKKSDVANKPKQGKTMVFDQDAVNRCIFGALLRIALQQGCYI